MKRFGKKYKEKNSSHYLQLIVLKFTENLMKKKTFGQKKEIETYQIIVTVNFLQYNLK